MTENPDPVLAIAAVFARISGQELPAASHDNECNLLTSRFGADAHMARSRITGSIELNNEVVELQRDVSALWVGHEIVQTFPDLFSIPALPQPEPEPLPPAPGPVCWEDGARGRFGWTLGQVQRCEAPARLNQSCTERSATSTAAV
jgi:hypothetical protein